jgi:hypothetical protein
VEKEGMVGFGPKNDIIPCDDTGDGRESLLLRRRRANRDTRDAAPDGVDDDDDNNDGNDIDDADELVGVVGVATPTSSGATIRGRSLIIFSDVDDVAVGADTLCVADDDDDTAGVATIRGGDAMP